jgi:hypothetical protein
MPKLDPQGEVLNPIQAKLAQDIARPIVTKHVGMPDRQELTVVTQRPVLAPTGPAKLSKAKKVLFTVEEQKENDAVVAKLAAITGADTLTWSHIDRAFWSLLRQAHDHVDRHVKDAPKLVRPSNGNPIGLAEFEDRLASFLHRLLKDTPRSL